MKVKDLQPFESIRLTEGTGGCNMHVINGGTGKIYVTRDLEIKEVNETDQAEANQFCWKHFNNEEGEKSNTLDVINYIRTHSHDWYSLLLCEVIYDGIHEKA